MPTQKSTQTPSTDSIADPVARSVRLQYFAQLRTERGCAQETRMSTANTPESLFMEIFGRLPVGIQFAINDRLVLANTPLNEHDTVSFLPPFGGG